MRIIIGLILFLFSIQSANAQESELHKRALVAGFKAAFTCSATFNAGKDYAEIARDELSMIMPDYRELMAFLPDPIINKVRKMVFVSYGEGLPPRIAVWRKHLGCTQLPIGASRGDAAIVPTIELQPR
ncbi:MAG: serine hydrolase, partial [Sphingomonadales bacterium]